MKSKIDQATEFLNKNEHELIDFIEVDLRIEIDHECSKIYDTVTEKFHDVSFQEIVRATKNRIVVALETFNEEK